MPRACVVTALCVFAMLRAAPARAGGRHERHEPTAADIRMEETRARWQKQGLAAAPEMIAVLCGGDASLNDAAAGELVRIGAAAMPQLFKASRNADCRVEDAMAAIVCGPPSWEMERQRKAWDAALSELLKMAGGRDEKTASFALKLLSIVAHRGRLRDCEMQDEINAKALPILAARLRARDCSATTVLRIVVDLGPIAAPLVPDVIPFLQDKDRASSAMSALSAIGPKATTSVPALRAMFRAGGEVQVSAIAALGGIGAPAAPAFADFAPVLKQALADLCTAKPRLTAGDTIIWVMAPAVARIGGPAMAPLFPDLVAGYRRLRACEMLGSFHWPDLFVAAAGAGAAVAPTLVAVAFDPDERLPVRTAAVASLGKVGVPVAARDQLAVLSAAIARKEAVFRRDDRAEPQLKAPEKPGSPRTPYALDLCRREAGLPEPKEPRPTAAEAALLDATGRYATFSVHDSFAYCVADRLCGPDAATYKATVAACCKQYGRARPWFCESGQIP